MGSWESHRLTRVQKLRRRRGRYSSCLGNRTRGSTTSWCNYRINKRWLYIKYINQQTYSAGPLSSVASRWYLPDSLDPEPADGWEYALLEEDVNGDALGCWLDVRPGLREAMNSCSCSLRARASSDSSDIMKCIS
jgi:hypothetical protein